MKSFDIRIETYGTKAPDIVESSVVDAAEQGKNYLNPAEFMYLGDFDDINAAFQHHANVAADDAYCKQHDC